MAWPYDTKDVTYAAGSQVPSTNLNNIQTEINNIAGSHVVIYQAGYSENNSGSPSYVRDFGSITVGWHALAAGLDLMIFLDAREGAVLQKVDIKYRQETGSATWAFAVVPLDCKFTATTTAPSFGAIDSSSPAPSSGWNVETLSGGGLPYTIPAETRLVCQITAPTINDNIFGVQATFDQFY